MPLSFNLAASQDVDRYRMLTRLQIALGLGCAFVLLYAAQFYGSGAVIRVAAVGILVAGASLFVGFLLGFIFCIPRTAKSEAIAASSSGTTTGSRAEVIPPQSTARADTSVETNTNLIDISDWLTKILVGVGLVELNKIPQNLKDLCSFLGPGLRADECGASVRSSESFALGIVIFFFGIGFLIGYLWTRLYFQRALAELEDQRRRENEAWLKADYAELLIGDDNLGEAMRVVDRALEINPLNAKALVVKGRILKRLAEAVGETTHRRELLREALSYATRANTLNPDMAAPWYNMACYQALLEMDKAEVLNNLKRAFQLRPTLKEDAKKDEDLRSLWEDAEFKSLTGNPPAAD